MFDSPNDSFVLSAIYPKLYCYEYKVRLKILNLEVLKEYFFFILEVTFKGIMTQHSRRIFLACISISKEDFSLLDTNGSSKSQRHVLSHVVAAMIILPKHFTACKSFLRTNYLQFMRPLIAFQTSLKLPYRKQAGRNSRHPK